jgi:hypothetical protein
MILSEQFLRMSKLAGLLTEDEIKNNSNKIPIIHTFHEDYPKMCDYKFNFDINHPIINHAKERKFSYFASIGIVGCDVSTPLNKEDIKGYYKIYTNNEDGTIFESLGIKYKYLTPDSGQGSPYFLISPDYVEVEEKIEPHYVSKAPRNKKLLKKYEQFKEILQQQGCKIILNDHNKSKYSSDKNGGLKINSLDTYDFGGAEAALNNLATVVDYDYKYKEGDKPKIKTYDDTTEFTGNNKYINQDLNKPFSFPPKMYGNMTSVYHHLENKNNIVNSIYNSLKPGGIFFISCSFIDVFDIYKRFSQKFKIIEIVIDEQELLDQNFDESARNGEYFYLTFKK